MAKRQVPQGEVTNPTLSNLVKKRLKYSAEFFMILISHRHVNHSPPKPEMLLISENIVRTARNDKSGTERDASKLDSAVENAPILTTARTETSGVIVVVNEGRRWPTGRHSD